MPIVWRTSWNSQNWVDDRIDCDGRFTPKVDIAPLSQAPSRNFYEILSSRKPFPTDVRRTFQPWPRMSPFGGKADYLKRTPSWSSFYRRPLVPPSTLTLPPILTHVSEPGTLAKPNPYCSQGFLLTGCSLVDFGWSLIGGLDC